MKEKSTQLLSFALCIGLWANAGTPTINGILEDGDGWGAAVGTGDLVAGWNDANAQRVYSTFDANYVYFAAEFVSRSWHQFMFVVNTKPGGTNTDAWGRTLSYEHANKPDFVFRGDIAKQNYTQFQVWEGGAWTNTSNNVNESGTEVVSTFLNTTNREFPNTAAGTIEIRVPRSLIGTPSVGDFQFIIGGNNGGAGGHGCFDAIPDDNNGSSWDAPGNFTILSKYISGIALPAGIGSFTGSLRQGLVQLNWNTLTESNLAQFDVEQSFDGRNWQKAGTVKALNVQNGGSYGFSIPNMTASFALYRLRILDKDGSASLSRQVTLKAASQGASFELIGNPARGSVKVAIHQPKAHQYLAELVTMDGKRLTTQKYNHPGGSSVLSLSVNGLAAGTYLLRLTDSENTQKVMKMSIL